jgi:CDP-4-dehydro-6-deoxyglucose reductase, E3
MARLRYQGLELAPGETVLDGLQAEGVRVASSCKVGACQTCQSRPEEDLEIGERGVPSLDARVVEVQPLGEALVRIRLRTTEAMEFRPGQFVHLERTDGLIRA